MITDNAAQELASRDRAAFPRALDFLFADMMPGTSIPVRYKVSYGGRGAGKTENYARALLMMGAADPQRILCAREYQNSIKQSVHKTIAGQIDAMKMNYLYEVENGRIFHRTIPTEFIFEGMHGNIDRIKSYAKIKKCWIEEGQSTLQDSFETLDPTIRELASQVWVSFNPILSTDYIFDHFVNKTPPDNAIVRKISFRDNPWFPDVLRKMMLQMRESDPDAYMNIWEGEPRLLLAGAVYAEELRAARAGGRICDVPYEPLRPVDMTWDLGHADKTAIWLTQQVGFELRFVDYYECSGKPLSHYLEWLQARKSSHGQHYVYGLCNLPHDAKAKQLGTKLSVEEQLAAVFGRSNVRVLPRLSLTDGINAARTMFTNCYFDKKRCADGITALSHYRYEVVEKQTGRGPQLSRVPVHDENSHGADAFRYVAIGRKLPKASVMEMRAKMQVELTRATMDGDMYSTSGWVRPRRNGRSWMGKL